ncbi:MAG TPA: (d)CMP kinase [Candidatus Saccharimonadales bacterium]|nr:(d)CMP kinase [Candidatus Saccharimonadales bacterium]
MSERATTAGIITGDARGGKDTAADALVDRFGHPLVEAGRLYRLNTFHQLYQARTISLELPKEEISSHAGEIESEELFEVLGGIDAFIAQHGLGRLYESDINSMVGYVANTEVAQKVTDQEVGNTIRRLIERGEPHIIAVGRQLAHVAIAAGAEVALNAYFECTVEEAARRERLRKKVQPDTPQWDDIFTALQKRYAEDHGREINTVAPEDDAWRFHQKVEEEGFNNFTIGVAAAAHGVQIVLDTTRTSRDEMCAISQQMYAGALAYSRAS